VAVAGLAIGGGTEVVVLHVDEHDWPEESERVAAESACALIALAVDARPEVRAAAHGGVAAEIAAAAADHGADLVVLGSPGRSDLGGLLLGGLGHEVLTRAPCPLVVARAGRRATSRRGRVLLALAGDEDPDDLVRTTAAIANRDSQVLVLHVLAPGDDDPWVAPSQQLVDRMVLGLRRCGVRARGRVPTAAHPPAHEVAGAALGYGADLVVMVSRRLPALTALLRPA
jgi:nucleotide-binding universal stress UspA family protein